MIPENLGKHPLILLPFILLGALLGWFSPKKV
jgi:hypothetical protein